jgi:hypothetical protein
MSFAGRSVARPQAPARDNGGAGGVPRSTAPAAPLECARKAHQTVNP